MPRRSRSSPPGATVTSTAELACSATPTVAARCVRPLATSSSLGGSPLQRMPSLTLVRISPCRGRRSRPAASSCLMPATHLTPSQRERNDARHASSTRSDGICSGRFHGDNVVAALAVDQLVVGIDAGAGRLPRYGDADRLLAALD